MVSVDGFGDFASTVWGVGNGRDIKIEGRTTSALIGVFYQAMTHASGSAAGGEYKVMGQPYGPIEAMRKIVRLKQAAL